MQCDAVNAYRVLCGVGGLDGMEGADEVDGMDRKEGVERMERMDGFDDHRKYLSTNPIKTLISGPLTN